MQSESIDLNTAVDLLQSLSVFVGSLRDRFDEYVTNGGELSGTSEFTVHRARKRNTRLNPLDYGKAENTSLEHKDSLSLTSLLSTCYSPNWTSANVHTKKLLIDSAFSIT